MKVPGPSLTNANCHSDICPGKNCPGDICPYQEYLSRHRPNLDETLKVASREHPEQADTCPGNICPGGRITNSTQLRQMARGNPIPTQFLGNFIPT